MTEVAKNKGKKEETTENDSFLEDEFDEYLKIPVNTSLLIAKVKEMLSQDKSIEPET